METRKITIISTKNHSTKVINSAATTLGELKTDLDNAGIGYTDCTFFEGLTKTELKNDAAILPHDVPYKGTTTNNLVFMITNASKKIRSGAKLDRKAIIEEIKAKNLTEVVKKVYDKNYTNCKTEDLERILSMNNNSAPKEAPAKKETVETKSNTSVPNDTEYITKAQLKEVITGLVEEMKYVGMDYSNEINIDNISIIGDISSSNSKKKDDSPYSSNELDDMFKDM